LNIANSIFDRNSVIASPTLLLVDRVGSTFLTGANLTLGLQGGLQGSASFADRPIGFSLAVIPTFIDDDHAMLSIRMTRSSLQVVPQEFIFDRNSFATNHNVIEVSAVVGFNEPVILTGFQDREKNKLTNSAPILGHIPIIQYLFRNNLVLDQQKQVISLITLRRPDRADASGSQAAQMLQQIKNHDSSQMDRQIGSAFGVEQFSRMVRGDLLFPAWSKDTPSLLIRELNSYGYLTPTHN